MERARALYSTVDLTILLANKKHSSDGDDLMNKAKMFHTQPSITDDKVNL